MKNTKTHMGEKRSGFLLTSEREVFFFKVGYTGFKKLSKLAKLAEFQRRSFESAFKALQELWCKARSLRRRGELIALPPRARVLASRRSQPREDKRAALCSAQPVALQSSPAQLGATRCISAQLGTSRYSPVSRQGKQHTSPALHSSGHSGGHAACPMGADPRNTGPRTGHVNLGSLAHLQVRCAALALDLCRF